MDFPGIEEINKGVKEFRKNEGRAAMYKVASFLIDHFWGKPAEMADGLSVLLSTWNQAFYRYGTFDLNKLEKCIRDNLPKIKKYRSRNISSLSASDEKDIKKLFNEFLMALKQINKRKKEGHKSPVSVAKAIHLLAPKFFPLWDDKIARAYGCHYSNNPAEQYIKFCKIMKGFSERLKDKVSYKDWPFLKIVDEYNYSKHTKHWI